MRPDRKIKLGCWIGSLLSQPGTAIQLDAGGRRLLPDAGRQMKSYWYGSQRSTIEGRIA